MTMDLALRATEILLGLAILQQSAEHLVGPKRLRMLFAIRMMLSVALVSGLYTTPALIGLSIISLALLHIYQGPYNGGSDRMGTLILFCLTGAQIAPSPTIQDPFFAYLAVQTVLSYFVSGKVKLTNPEWRNGHALRDVFAFSTYPVSEELRRIATRKRTLFAGSWAVILFEIAFPFALLHQNALIVALCIGAAFHLANALLFGLNRFLWTWLAAYPSLFWLQDRLIT